MKIEEAIEDLKEMIELHEDNCLITTEDDFESIKILLDAYSKEKEKNKELMQDKIDLIKEHNVVKMKDVQEELLSMRNTLDLKQAEMEMLNNIIDTTYISKNKIREKIKELRKDILYTRANIEKIIETWLEE